jgi:hypothetical protein
MVLLKMRIRRTGGNGCTHYDYPKQYDAHKIVFGPIYESGLEEVAQKVRDRNAGDEFIIIGIDEADKSQFMQSNLTPDADGFIHTCVELTEEETAAIGGTWTKQQEKITDRDKVLRITAKSARGEALTEEEKNALDPDHAESGIVKTKHFSVELREVIEAHSKYKGKK